MIPEPVDGWVSVLNDVHEADMRIALYSGLPRTFRGYLPIERLSLRCDGRADIMRSAQVSIALNKPGTVDRDVAEYLTVAGGELEIDFGVRVGAVFHYATLATLRIDSMEVNTERTRVTIEAFDRAIMLQEFPLVLPWATQAGETYAETIGFLVADADISEAVYLAAGVDTTTEPRPGSQYTGDRLRAIHDAAATIQARFYADQDGVYRVRAIPTPDTGATPVWAAETGGSAPAVIAKLTDAYDSANADAEEGLWASSATGVAQSFTGDGGELTAASWWMRRAGTPPGTVVARLWSHGGGSYGGAGSKPTTLIATSSEIPATDVPPAVADWVTLPFGPGTTLVDGTPYFISCEVIDSGTNPAHLVTAGYDISSPTHAGSAAVFTSSWTDVGGMDFAFRVYTEHLAAAPFSGSRANIIEFDQSYSRRDQYNAIALSVEPPDSDTSILVFLVDADPTSPTFWLGPFGRKVLEERSDDVMTEAQAIEKATTLLDQYQGATRALNLTTIYNPLLEPDDAILVKYGDAADEIHFVDAWEISFPRPAMKLETRLSRSRTYDDPLNL